MTQTARKQNLPRELVGLFPEVHDGQRGGDGRANRLNDAVAFDVAHDPDQAVASVLQFVVAEEKFRDAGDVDRIVESPHCRFPHFLAQPNAREKAICGFSELKSRHLWRWNESNISQLSYIRNLKANLLAPQDHGSAQRCSHRFQSQNGTC